MKNTKIIDKIYASNTPPPAHLRGNVLEIKNTSDKNYNLKVGNTLVSPVCSVDSFSALEKESNGRIGTLGIVASQSSRTRSGAITDIIPLSNPVGDEEDISSYPLIPIADMSLSSSINLSDEEWDTLRATYDDNDDECYLYQAFYFSEDSVIQVVYDYIPAEMEDEEILEIAPGVNIQISSDVIMGYLYYGGISEYSTAMFVIQRNGDSTSALLWGSNDAEEPFIQVGSSFKDTIKLFMQKVPNFGLQLSMLGNLPEHLAHKAVNLLIPSVTALTVPSFEGVYIRNTNSWDTVVTSKNLASMLPRMEHVDATNELPELKWGTCYDIFLDNNFSNGPEYYLPYKSDAIAPDQLLMVRIALNARLIEGYIRHDLEFPNEALAAHWINGKSPNNPANMTQSATRGVLNIIMCAFGVGYAYWTNN